MRIADISVPVVVLKAEEYGALGIVRSLGRLGVRVHAIDASPAAPALRSRYCTRGFVWNIDTSPAEESLRFLREVASKVGGRPILIPTGDASSVFVAENAEALQHMFLFPMPPAGTTQALYDKKQMYYSCKRLGIPTAETAFPQCRQDVLDFLENASCPVVLKAIDPWLLQQRTGVRMVIVETREKLLEEYDRLEDPEHPNLMLQEYIPGGEDTVWMFNGYFNAQSDCLFGVTGKKIRLFPVYTGMTSLGICLKNEVVDKNTRDFMKAVCYRGILDIGHRYDARNSEYKILDVNPRIGATFRLFVDTAGMDVARALYLDLTGQPVPTGEFPEGRKWFVEDKDVISSFHYHRDGRLKFGQWARSFRGAQEAAYFAWDDLRPFSRPVASITRHFTRWFRKRRQAAPAAPASLLPV